MRQSVADDVRPAGLHPPAASDGAASHDVGGETRAAPGGATPDRAPSTGAVVRATCATGRRLLVAFSVVVLAFGLAIVAAYSGIAKVEATLARVGEHEEEMNLALALESAVRDQYAHHANVLLGDRDQRGDYAEARERAADIGRRLARSAGPEDLELIQAVVSATEEFHGIDEGAEGTDGASAHATGTAREHAYALVASIEGRLDLLFKRQHAALVALRDVASAAQAAALRRMMVLFVCAVLFAVVMGLYIQRAVTRPLARLGEGAVRLSRGEMDTRIVIAGDDEFAAVAAQFNAMMGALKESQRRLVHGEKLAAVGRLAAGVAHELNSPLTVMLGYLQLQRDRSGGELEPRLAKVEQEAVRCRDIVRDLLELSRPGGVYACSPVDLRRVCDDVVDRLRGSGQLSSVELEVAGAGAALGDEPRLRQVVANLVRNAAEAAGPRGRVRLAVTTTASNVEVAVSDSGPGVPDSVRGRLFEPFFTTKPTGTGLGLAVSRAVVLAHGGDVLVGSGELGGARFAVTLPRT